VRAQLFPSYDRRCTLCSCAAGVTIDLWSNGTAARFAAADRDTCRGCDSRKYESWIESVVFPRRYHWHSAES